MMACMDDKALTAIALHLYALPFDEFMAARTAAAKAATGSGKELPAAVKALPKPSVAAWAVNMLAVHESAVLAQLADLGERMRAAQSSLDAPALRELARERRALLSDAVDTARSVAERHGRAISATIATDVERTLGALITDEGAAAAVQSGLLVQTLSADGVDTVDLDGAVAVPGTAPAPRVAPPHTSSPPGAAAPKQGEQQEGTTTEGAARQPADQPRLRAVRETPRPASPSALEKAKAVLADAKAAEEEAARLAIERRDQLAETEEEVAELTRETRELRAQLKAAEERLDSARKWLSTAAAEAKQAARAAEKAQRSAVLAQERVLRLGNPVSSRKSF
jgi:DNA-binding transcriptional MerR regulator